MNRRLAAIVLSVFFVGVLVAGCQKPADQQPAPAGDSAPVVAEVPKPVEEKPAPPKPLIVPADTVLTVALDQAVSSKASKPGDRFSATVEFPVEVDGKVAIPKGSRARGIVSEAKAAGRFKGAATLALSLRSVTVHGKEYEVQAAAPTMASKGKGKRTAGMVGGGAAGGAVIGGIAGGGKGAAIGALIGAGAGVVGAGATGNRDISLPAETALDFKLLHSIAIKQKE